MARWKVYNVHSHGLTHVEKFKDETISIKAGEFVEMDYEDAVQFKGQYFPIKKNAQNVQDPASFKMIKLEPVNPDEPIEAANKIYVSHIDGKEFQSKAALEAYLNQNYSDSELIVKDEALDKELAKKKKG